MEAEKLANDIRSAINAGTCEREADRAERTRRDANDARDQAKQAAAALPTVVTVESFAAIYIERASKASGKDAGRRRRATNTCSC
jgi:hypothetical protein